MALVVKDRVQESSTSTGTGALTLAGAYTGYQRFSAVCSTNDTLYYVIEALDSNGNPVGDWEAGLGTYSATNTLTRTTPQASSNSGSAVNFAAGTKRVSLDVTAGYLATYLASTATARTNLGLAIGTDVQAYSTKLASIAANTVTTDSGTSRTAALGDADTFIRFTSSSAVTFTIPPNSSVAFPVGTQIDFSQSGTGAVSAAAGSGVTINSRSSDLTLAGQYAVAFVKKVASDTWIMNGDL